MLGRSKPPVAAADRALRVRCVGDVMTRALVTVTAADPVADALAVASLHEVHHLLVLDGGTLAGEVCEFDLATAAASATVGDIMRRDLVTVGAHAPLVEAARRMREHAVGCLPVIAGGLLLGIVARGDLRRVGIPDEALLPSACACCGADRHVRRDPRGSEVVFCVDCLERATPPGPTDDVGVGD